MNSKSQDNQILRARASALAKEFHAPAPIADPIKILRFGLGGEEYALPADRVREVYGLRGYTRVPCTPDFVLGIMNIRGEILSILDLRRFFEVPPKGLTNLNKVIVIQAGDLALGLLADVVTGMELASQLSFHVPAPAFNDRRADYVAGVSAQQVILLNLEAILNDDRLVVNSDTQL